MILPQTRAYPEFIIMSRCLQGVSSVKLGDVCPPVLTIKLMVVIQRIGGKLGCAEISYARHGYRR